MFNSKNSPTAKDVDIGLMQLRILEPNEKETQKPSKKKMAPGTSRRRKKSRYKRADQNGIAPPIHLNPLTPKILLVILLTVCHIVLVMLV